MTKDLILDWFAVSYVAPIYGTSHEFLL